MKSIDTRYFQILILSSLLLYGIFSLQFSISVYQILAVIFTSLVIQIAFIYTTKISYHSLLSALITSLSLSILLRADELWVYLLAAFIAITSKFFIHFQYKHIFNPTALALTILSLSGIAWISPAQWGNVTWFAFLVASLGVFMFYRIKTFQTPLAFILVYAGLLTIRTIYLGDSFAILLHQLQGGAIILFIFFMISDPKTMPNHQTARWIFGALVAVIAFSIQFNFYIQSAPILALTFCAPLVLLLDKYFKKHVFTWRK